MRINKGDADLHKKDRYWQDLRKKEKEFALYDENMAELWIETWRCSTKAPETLNMASSIRRFITWFEWTI